MFKHSATNLLEQPLSTVTEWLASFDTVISDCDGVIWVLSKNIDGSIETLNRLREKGKKVFYCTNNSADSRRELTEKAQKMGLTLVEQDMICTAHSTAAYLKSKNFNKRVYVVGAQGLATELDAVGIAHIGIGPDVIDGPVYTYLRDKLTLDENIGAVVVGRDEHFSFPKITKAATYLNNPECLFIATNRDERFPLGDVIYPGTGCFVAAIEVVAERYADVIGKPNPDFCDMLIKTGQIEPCRTLMIGDNLGTDILLGYNCGFQTLLVGTGIHNLEDVNLLMLSDDCEDKKKIPDVFLPSLGDLRKFL